MERTFVFKDQMCCLWMHSINTFSKLSRLEIKRWINHNSIDLLFVVFQTNQHQTCSLWTVAVTGCLILVWCCWCANEPEVPLYSRRSAIGQRKPPPMGLTVVDPTHLKTHYYETNALQMQALFHISLVEFWVCPCAELLWNPCTVPWLREMKDYGQKYAD